jgi:hypothetical protein
MKKFWTYCLAAMIAASAAAKSQAALTPGSIAFVGFNADGLDNLTFVAIEPLPIGTEIGFTDNEWNGAAWADNNEHGFAWTATSNVPAGAIVTLDFLNDPILPSPTSNFGTTLPIAGAGANKGVSNSDEAIWAFIGPYASPTAFLAVIGNDPLATAATSLTGTGLVEGQTALFVTGDEDVMAYTGARSGQSSFAAYLPLINNPASWVTQDGSGDQSIDSIAPDVPFDSTPFTIVPEPASLSLLALAAISMLGFRSRH